MIINKKLLSPVLPESMEDIVTDSVYLLDKQENEEEVRDIVKYSSGGRGFIQNAFFNDEAGRVYIFGLLF
jgi:hypothetical protein